MIFKTKHNFYKLAIIALILLAQNFSLAADTGAKEEILVKNVWVDVPLSQVFRDISVENGIIIATCPHVPDPLVSLDAAKGKPLEECINDLISGQGLYIKKKNDRFFMIVCGDPTCPSAVETITPAPIYLNYISAKHLRESLPKSLQQYVSSGQRDNEALIYAVPEISAHILDIIKKLDVPQEQVMLEVLVVDLREGTGDMFQLDWDMLGSHTNFSMSKGFAGFSGLAGYTSVARDLTMLNLTLRALIEEKKASIRSRPRVATLNGEKAKIDISLDEYYTIVTDLYGTSLRTELEVIKSGVMLEMVPHIGEDGFITIDVQTEVSDVATRRSTAGCAGDVATSSDLPIIRRRKADTHVRVREGDAIVIGGLIETQESTNHGKFPLLGDMPVVGGLFKSKQDTTEKKEVMIFITPQIIKDNQMAFADRNTLINGLEETEKLRSPNLAAKNEKIKAKKQKDEEVKSLSKAVTILDDQMNSQDKTTNTVASNQMSPEEEKQMLQEAINLLAVDTQAK
ncbi:MAG: hypothetical protein A2Y12_14910 [Planctomycetes bacterium GWF2_42_9]|nr:MAG: hypothetical protein A2Y12_14910 [Planctomycetes bacterium GWF2_42_9]HAL46019.1 hypothetical protein [Phycisphaerales bacterium]